MTTVLRKLALAFVAAGLLGVVGCGEDNDSNAMSGTPTDGGAAPAAPKATSSEDYYNQMKGQQTTYGPGNPAPKAEAPANK